LFSSYRRHCAQGFRAAQIQQVNSVLFFAPLAILFQLRTVPAATQKLQTKKFEVVLIGWNAVPHSYAWHLALPTSLALGLNQENSPWNVKRKTIRIDPGTKRRYRGESRNILKRAETRYAGLRVAFGKEI